MRRAVTSEAAFRSPLTSAAVINTRSIASIATNGTKGVKDDARNVLRDILIRVSEHEADTVTDDFEMARNLSSLKMIRTVVTCSVRRLQRRGYKVDAVTNGAACLRQIEAIPPDLLFLDIQMPQLSGLEVLKAVGARFSHDAVR